MSVWEQSDLCDVSHRSLEGLGYLGMFADEISGTCQA